MKKRATLTEPILAPQWQDSTRATMLVVLELAGEIAQRQGLLLGLIRARWSRVKHTR